MADSERLTVTVTDADGVTLAALQYDDENVQHTFEGVIVTLRDAMIPSFGATTWQRVAHAAAVVAWSEMALSGDYDE